MKQIDDLMLTGLRDEELLTGEKYARAYGRCSAILEGVVLRMNENEREAFFKRITEHASHWKKVEESAT